ncbi:MAG: hypothetical protein AB7N76_06605 [Planctomycetota bacterium]
MHLAPTCRTLVRAALALSALLSAAAVVSPSAARADDPPPPRSPDDPDDGPKARDHEVQVISVWRDLLDVPLAKTRAHDLAWIVEPERKAPPRPRFFLDPLAPERGALRYLGYQPPGKCAPFDGVHQVPGALGTPRHVWAYRDRFYVLTASDGRREQLAVYALLRALEVLRQRLPRAWEELYAPRDAGEQLARLRANDPKKPVSFLNVTRAHAFVIEGGFSAIAKSEYDLGTRKAQQVQSGRWREASVGVFENVATTWINLDAIQGHRSHKLYEEEDPLVDFIRYLRDGVCETLVHEGLHCLLRRDKNVRPLFWAITHSVRDLGGEELGKACEEAFVTNVSIGLVRARAADGVRREYQAHFQRGLRQRLGLVEGKETDQGVALRALLARYAGRPDAPYEQLFSFPVGE